jgi:ubiquitin C-terminal hydrolase
MQTLPANFSQYKENGLKGLVNLGNTCFINACVQILSHTYEVNNLLSKKEYKKRVSATPDAVLLIEWDNLRKSLWEKDGAAPVKPTKFLQTIHKLSRIKGINTFTGYDQNDVSEFFVFIIDCFHNAISRKVQVGINGVAETNEDRIAIVCYNMIRNEYSTNYSEFIHIFFGTLVSQIISLDTKEELSIKAEPFCTLSLPIPEKKGNNNSCTLMDCFELFSEGEILSGENKYYNEKKGVKEDVVKKMSFWGFPTILVIDLKRFNSRGTKNQMLIQFPLDDMDLSKYVIGYDKETYIYDLYGVCNHSGGVLGGHYTAFVKNADGVWFLFNDTTVTQVSAEAIISSKAYCLFYRKKQISI